MTYAFMNGEFMPLSEAKVGVMTHALHYGTAIFEGIRGNWNPEQEKMYIFRPREHYQRLLQGCKVMRINVPYTADELTDITVDLVERCGYQQDIYIRPLAFKGAERVAVLKLQDLSDSLVIFTIAFGAYLDLEEAANCCTSSWRRMEDTMIPPRVKIAGLYVNSVLAKTEATLAGFDEAILLTQEGYVSEGAGENIFTVMDGKLVTPCRIGQYPGRHHQAGGYPTGEERAWPGDRGAERAAQRTLHRRRVLPHGDGRPPHAGGTD